MNKFSQTLCAAALIAASPLGFANAVCKNTSVTVHNKLDSDLMVRSIKPRDIKGWLGSNPSIKGLTRGSVISAHTDATFTTSPGSSDEAGGTLELWVIHGIEAETVSFKFYAMPAGDYACTGAIVNIKDSKHVGHEMPNTNVGKPATLDIAFVPKQVDETDLSEADTDEVDATVVV